MTNDCVIQTRCKSTILATITKYLSSRGALESNASALIRDALELLAQGIIVKHPEMEVQDTATARRILADRGIIRLNPSRRGERNLVQNLEAASLVGGLNDDGDFA
jgi:hypothetical protein